MLYSLVIPISENFSNMIWSYVFIFWFSSHPSWTVWIGSRWKLEHSPLYRCAIPPRSAFLFSFQSRFSIPTSIRLRKSPSTQPRRSPAKFVSQISEITYWDRVPNDLYNSTRALLQMRGRNVDREGSWGGVVEWSEKSHHSCGGAGLQWGSCAAGCAAVDKLVTEDFRHWQSK